MLLRFCALAAALALTACAAATPGFVPPSSKTSHMGKFGKVGESGKMDEDGNYALSNAEKAMNCRRITGSMQITIARLKDSYGRADPSALASAMQKTVVPVLGGSTVGADRKAELARERAKLDAYNEKLVAQGCKPLDIDAELARPADGPKKY